MEDYAPPASLGRLGRFIILGIPAFSRHDARSFGFEYDISVICAGGEHTHFRFPASICALRQR